MTDWIPVPHLLDLVDMLLVAGFTWLAIRYSRRTRALTALSGLALLAGVYAVARSLELRVTAALLQGFFAVVVIVLVVVFQEDLRRVFEGLGSWRPGKRHADAPMDSLDLLARVLSRLAASRTGALIVLPGREPIGRHVEGGVALSGRISEPILLSIFDASSPGHDGACILRGDRIERFAVHLPLSSNHALLGAGGTRHAAALGLAERCDATVIVVSEERGTVSIARNGTIRTLPRPEDLAGELRISVEEESDTSPEKRRDGWRDAAMAAGAALLLWMVFVPGSAVTDTTLIVRPAVTNLPPDLELEAIEPDEVEIVVRGLRRDLLLAQRIGPSVTIDAYLARFGRRTFSLAEDDVRTSSGVSVIAIEPEKVKISLRPRSVDTAPPPP
jgi:diadenylate cyclase